jgi:hypothetical protein
MASKKLLAAIGGGVVAAAAVGVAVVLVSQTAPEAATKPDTFTMRGSIRIDNVGTGHPFTNTGSSCSGAGGYSDITPGAAVIVKDVQGQTVATGALQVGYPATTTMSMPAIGISATPYVYACSLAFSVPKVPAGLERYTVTVSHRGTQVVTEADARQSVDLVLNSTK